MRSRRGAGFDTPVAEESVAHALVSGLGAHEQIAARRRLPPTVGPGPTGDRSAIRRRTPRRSPMCWGGWAASTLDTVANDPNADDPFARYRADERRGISGVELAAESRLRGAGVRSAGSGGRTLQEEHVSPLDGRDVTLTLHEELQRRLFDLLGQTVERIPASSGGVIVVLDVESREVLALVS